MRGWHIAVIYTSVLLCCKLFHVYGYHKGLSIICEFLPLNEAICKIRTLNTTQLPAQIVTSHSSSITVINTFLISARNFFLLTNTYCLCSYVQRLLPTPVWTLCYYQPCTRHEKKLETPLLTLTQVWQKGQLWGVAVTWNIIDTFAPVSSAWHWWLVFLTPPLLP